MSDKTPLVSKPVERESARWLVNLILLLGVVVQLSRIVQVQSQTGETPFLSANDRSRWCTVASLAVNGSYEIDDILEIRDPKTRRRTWYTIDLVRHRGQDGKQHYYSSKPPLLPTMYAGVYIAVRAVTGATLMNDPFFIAPIMLILVNLIPLLAFWWLIAYWFRDELEDSWAAIVLALFVAGGTYLSTFATSLNNHIPAAIAVGISLFCIDRIALKNDTRIRWFALCGLCTSFGVANELPALSWVCAAGAILASVDFKKTAVWYTLSLLPVAVAFFGTNYIAHGEFAPAYAHRNIGAELLQSELTVAKDDATDLPDATELARELRTRGLLCSDNSIVRPARREGILELWDEENQIRYALKASENKVQDEFSVRVYRWGDWYDYPGSYWTSDRKQGVDRGEPNRAVYIFHCLFGHHGIFSLTPFWFVALAGCYSVWSNRQSMNIFRDRRLLVAAAIMATSAIVIAFYFARGLEDRNYGGVTSGFRWTFWLIPLWLWLAVHGLRSVRSPWARRVVEVLVILSVFSASYPWRNPWTSPWLMQLWNQ